jgi:hypothetical protein
LGGYAYFISGDVDKRHLDAAKVHKGLFTKMTDVLLDKLLNPKGEQSVDVSSHEFKSLKEKLTADLIDYLKKRIISEILPLDVSSLHVALFQRVQREWSSRG